MKILGMLLIVVGIICVAMVATGFLGLVIPVEANPSPASVAKSVGAKGLLLCSAGAACLIGGAVTIVTGIKKSRGQKRQGTRVGFRRLITVTLFAVILLACGVFVIFKLMTRWDPDEEWAAKVIAESAELRLLLEKYREENGEFPMSLGEIDEDYTKPTDYLSRHGAAPDTDRWHYDRIGTENYQLFVTADSWVSYFDAMVYRHTGALTEPWFSTRASSDSKQFGKWKYIRGFSRFHEGFYFDAEGKVHSNDP